MATLQAEIDRLVYPPTHTFTLAPLQATGLLEIRLGHLAALSPTFFSGTNLLDIGASKGFCSLLAAASGFKMIVAIEPQEEYAVLLRELMDQSLLPTSVVHQGKFGGYCKAHRPLFPQFDRVLIANVPHYLFGEYGGWGWWQDVADLCCDNAQVIVEGPVDMRDAGCFVPKLAPELEAKWNVGAALAAPLAAGFELRGAVDSPRPTSDRCMMFFVRRGRKSTPGGNRRIQKSSLRIARMWRETKTKPVHRIYESTSGLFCKEEDELRLDSEHHLDRLRAAARSPYAIPIEAFIYDGDTLVGWAEPSFVESLHWFKPGPQKTEVTGEEFRKVLRATCLHQIALIGEGYLDLDNGAGNWGCDAHGRMYVCDKGAVHPLEVCRRGFQVPSDYSMADPELFRDGSFFRLAYREFSEWLTPDHETEISEAVQSGDTGNIERAFLSLYQAT